MILLEVEAQKRVSSSSKYVTSTRRHGARGRCLYGEEFTFSMGVVSKLIRIVAEHVIHNSDAILIINGKKSTLFVVDTRSSICGERVGR